MKNIKKHISPVSLLIIVGVIILLASVALWCTKVRNSKKQVFNRMLDTSLSSSSASKVVTQSDESQTLRQRITLNTTPEQRVHEVDERFVQSSGTLVVTESIGTPQADFTRYTNIKTSQKSRSGGAFDFSKVLNVWGKSNQNSD
ncbi:MAG: hypothetical protein ABI354_01235, partial [Candidatus Saccharimonadales bacterium]